MSSPDLSDDDRLAVAEVLKTPRLSMGPNETAFEAAVAGYVGAKFGVAASPGRAGRHLAVRAAGIRGGDWVITTPFSFVASANVLLYEGATPIFVDVDPQTGNIAPGPVAEAAAGLMRGGRAGRRWLPRRGGAGGGRLEGGPPRG